MFTFIQNIFYKFPVRDYCVWKRQNGKKQYGFIGTGSFEPQHRSINVVHDFPRNDTFVQYDHPFNVIHFYVTDEQGHVLFHTHFSGGLTLTCQLRLTIETLYERDTWVIRHARCEGTVIDLVYYDAKRFYLTGYDFDDLNKYYSRLNQEAPPIKRFKQLNTSSENKNSVCETDN